MPASGALRPHVTLTTAGHVDHGKSTLLRALTGTDPDRLAEEHRRGLSIELGFVWCTLPATPRVTGDVEVAFVDVPGHERFVATMLAGVGPATASVLVVAADDGWSAQTQEHAEVLALLGVPVLATAISKTGPAGRDRAAQVAGEVGTRLRGLGLDGGPIVLTDAVDGAGLDELRRALREGVAALPPSADAGRPRLWIDRAFVIDGAGTVVTGTLTGGTLRTGEQVRLQPGGTEARIRGLASLGSEVGQASPGERVAVNLAGVDRAEVERGDALVAGQAWRTTGELDGWVQLLPGRSLRDKGAWQLYAGTARTAARLLPFPDPIEVAATTRTDGGSDPAARRGDDPAGTAQVGAAGAVRAVLERPLPLVAGDVLVIRDAGRRQVVGSIRVGDPFPARLPRGRARRVEHASTVCAVAHASTRARASSPDSRERGSAPAPAATLVGGLVALHGGVRPVAELAAATGGRVATEAGDDLLHLGDQPVDLSDHVVRLGDHVVDGALVGAWHRALAALGPGTHDRGSVLRVLHAAGAPAAVDEPLLRHLVERGALAVTDAGYALPGHADDDARRRAVRRDEVVAALDAAPLAPPPLDEVTRRAGADARDVAALVQEGRVIRAGPIAFSASAIEEAHRLLAASPLAARPFTAGEARDVLGTTRRYLIPLLEHLARIGVSSFDGAHHRLTGASRPRD